MYKQLISLMLATAIIITTPTALFASENNQQNEKETGINLNLSDFNPTESHPIFNDMWLYSTTEYTDENGQHVTQNLYISIDSKITTRAGTTILNGTFSDERTINDWDPVVYVKGSYSTNSSTPSATVSNVIKGVRNEGTYTCTLKESGTVNNKSTWVPWTDTVYAETYVSYKITTKFGIEATVKASFRIDSNGKS